MTDDQPTPLPTPAAVAELRAHVAELHNEYQANDRKTVIQLLKMIALELEHLNGPATALHKKRQDQSWKLVDMLRERQESIEDALMKVDPAIKWG